jgi:glycerol-3-phosphate acyltransferase PlsY
VTRPIVLLTLIPLAYLAGSIPFGLLVGKAKGIDPRKAGSGNIGATNLGRLLGGKYFALVFTLDLLKGLLPTLAAGAFLDFDARNALSFVSYTLWLSVGFAAILGHMYSVFIGFKGGKGVATSAGVILGVFPYYTIAAIVALLTFAVVFKLTKYVSVGSILAASVFTVVYLLLGLARRWDVFGRQLPLLVFAVLVTAMIIYKHRANLVRLRAGTELRFGAKA